MIEVEQSKVKLGDILNHTQSGRALFNLVSDIYTSAKQSNDGALLTLATQLVRHVTTLWGENIEVEQILNVIKNKPTTRPATLPETPSKDPVVTEKLEKGQDRKYIKLHLPHDKGIKADLEATIPRGKYFWSNKFSDWCVLEKFQDELVRVLAKRYPGMYLVINQEHNIWTVEDEEEAKKAGNYRKLEPQSS